MSITIPGFKILDKLGEGPLSTVWKAHQVSLDRFVAIKVLKQKFTTRPGDVHPVLKEARAAAALKHANIVQVYDAGEIEGAFYFVTEFVSGSTVGQLIRKKGTISNKSTLNMALVVAEALNHAHTAAGLVHRGINPDNILLDADGTVKVADLGLPKLADPSTLSAQLKAGTVQGKLNYISPEQAKCSIRIDSRTDMYGLGATMYHMLTGKMPFEEFPPREVLNQQITGFVRNPRDINSSVTSSLAHLVASMMMKDYKARQKDWVEVFSDIQKVSTGKVVVPRAAAADDKPPEGGEAPVSTLMPAKTQEPPPKRAKIPSRDLFEPEEQKPSIPWYIQLPAWSLMILWWLALAQFQLNLPPLQPAKATLAANPPTAANGVKPAPARPGQPPATGSAAKPAPVAIPTTTTTTQPADPEQDSLNMFKTSLAGLIAGGNVARACSLVEAELEYEHSPLFEKEMKEVREFLREARGHLDSVYARHLGKEISVKDKGQDRKVTIKEIKNGIVSAEYGEKMGSATIIKSLSFPLSRIDPAEMARWIGDDATPARAVLKFSVYLAKGDTEAAKRAAAKCGPLAAAMTQMVDSAPQEADASGKSE